MVEISKLEEEMNQVNRQLVQMESDSIFLLEKKQYQQMTVELEAWKLRKEDFKNEFYAELLSKFSMSYEALDVLKRFVTMQLDAKVEKLEKQLSDPEDTISKFLRTEEPETEGTIETIEESEVKRRVLEKMVVMSMALMGEINQELENSQRKTLAQFLLDREHYTYFPFEWVNLNEVRNRTIHTAIELSQLLVQFLYYLAGKESKLRRLKSMIESIKNLPRRCRVAEKFITLIEMAGDTMSELKLKGELMESTEEDELSNTLITQFFEVVLDMDSIMSFKNVPEKKGLVAGARIRLEGVLGQILYTMLGLKLKITKHKSAYWTTMKVIIPDLWTDMEYLPSENEEEGGSSAKQGEGAVGPSGTQGEIVAASSSKDDEARLLLMELERSIEKAKAERAAYASAKQGGDAEAGPSTKRDASEKPNDEAGPSGNDDDKAGALVRRKSKLLLRTLQSSLPIKCIQPSEKPDVEAGPSGNDDDKRKSKLLLRTLQSSLPCKCMQPLN